MNLGLSKGPLRKSPQRYSYQQIGCNKSCKSGWAWQEHCQTGDFNLCPPKFNVCICLCLWGREESVFGHVSKEVTKSKKVKKRWKRKRAETWPGEHYLLKCAAIWGLELVEEGMERVSISFSVYCVSHGNRNTHDFHLELDNALVRCADSERTLLGSAHSMKTNIFRPRDEDV